MRLLVTGAGGQLGHDLLATVPDGGSGCEVIGVTHSQLDVADRTGVMEALTTLRPEVVVHAGAWTAVDGCEEDPDHAYRVNSLGTRNVAEAARRVGAHVCYVSTDYVFDGTSDRPYREWDPTNPLSVYGKSKLGGERELSPSSTIVRTSWVCGAHGANMVKTVLRLAGGSGPLQFVDDQRGCPSFTFDLAKTIRMLALDRRPGVFHLTNEGDTTWYEFARQVLEAAGQDPQRVTPISTQQLSPPRPAPRPGYSVLDNYALRESGLPGLPPWQASLRTLVDQLIA